MKIPGLCAFILALMLLGSNNPALAQSIASVGGISNSDSPDERKQLEDLWKLLLARSADMQVTIQRLDGDRDRLLSTILTDAEKSDASPQLLGMTPRAAIVGIFCLRDPNIENTNSPSPESTKSEAIPSAAVNLWQEDQALLLKRVRTKAKQLVTCYRDYARLSHAFLNADGKVECKVKAPPEYADKGGQVEWDCEVKRVQGEIDRLVDDLKRSRNALTEMVGVNAVRQLDEKLNGPDSVLEKHRLRQFDQQFVDPVHHVGGTG